MYIHTYTHTHMRIFIYIDSNLKYLWGLKNCSVVVEPDRQSPTVGYTWNKKSSKAIVMWSSTKHQQKNKSGWVDMVCFPICWPTTYLKDRSLVKGSLNVLPAYSFQERWYRDPCFLHTSKAKWSLKQFISASWPAFSLPSGSKTEEYKWAGAWNLETLRRWISTGQMTVSGTIITPSHRR